MTHCFSDRLIRRSLGYRGANNFSFADNISILLMFYASSDSTGKRATGRPRPWLQHHDTSTPHPKIHAGPPTICRVDPHAQQMAAAERRHVGQLAHDQEVLGAHWLLGERHSYENPRRCLARGSGVEEGARWASVDQC